MGKMFALTNVDNFESINIKCDPEEAVLLREQFSSVLPGYHMNKKHWNTVLMDGGVSDRQIMEWIDRSYELVVGGLSKKLREELDANGEKPKTEGKKGKAEGLKLKAKSPGRKAKSKKLSTRKPDRNA